VNICHYCKHSIDPGFHVGVRKISMIVGGDTNKPEKRMFWFHHSCYSNWFSKMLNRPPMRVFFR